MIVKVTSEFFTQVKVKAILKTLTQVKSKKCLLKKVTKYESKKVFSRVTMLNTNLILKY